MTHGQWQSGFKTKQVVIESMLLTTFPVILSGICPDHLKDLLKHRLLDPAP